MSPSGMVEIPRLQAKRSFVMPAQAGIQVRFDEVQEAAWIPASAGMTEERKSTSSRQPGIPRLRAEGCLIVRLLRLKTGESVVNRHLNVLIDLPLQWNKSGMILLSLVFWSGPIGV